MPEPGANSYNFNDLLTNISIAYAQEMDNFIAPRALPQIPVQNLTGNVLKYDRDDWRRIEAEKVAEGSKPPKAGYGIDSSTKYDARNPVKLAKPVSRQERINAQSPVQPIEDAVQFVTNNVMLKRDKEFVNTFFGTSIWNTNLDGSTSDFTQWENDNGNPLEVIGGEIDTVQEKTGFRPNVLVLGPKVWTELKHHDALLDIIKHTQMGIVTKDLMAQALGIDEVLVPEVSEDTSQEGESASQSYMFGKQALLMYRPENPGLMRPSAGYVFVPNSFAGNDLGVGIRRYEKEEEDVIQIEGQMAYDMKLLEADLGVFFDNAIA